MPHMPGNQGHGMASAQRPRHEIESPATKKIDTAIKNVAAKHTAPSM